MATESISRSCTRPGPQLQHHGEVEAHDNQGLMYWLRWWWWWGVSSQSVAKKMQAREKGTFSLGAGRASFL